ncbi:hypothetical protein ACQPX6_29460 [Actinomycetospora sp. CA-101289]|uniref:hypothetical protein n=1 Tax=Actinomycetospora sp. CA-101289 TaxID=3239893 RepID=UPI003D98A8AF
MASSRGLPDTLVDELWRRAVAGIGPFAGAAGVADDAMAATDDDVEAAVRRIVGSHVRLAASTGLLSSLGGAATLVVTAPAGMTGLYLLSTRLAAAIARLRGRDLDDPVTRTAVMVCVLGGDGVELAERTGLDLVNASLLSGLRRLPPEVRAQLDTRIGYRLTSRFTRRGALNVTKLLPVVGAPFGAGADAMAMRTVATFAQAHL